MLNFVLVLVFGQNLFNLFIGLMPVSGPNRFVYGWVLLSEVLIFAAPARIAFLLFFLWPEVVSVVSVCLVCSS